MKEIKSNPGREQWIDVAKGIGILLVIAGHTFYMEAIRPIYAFHLPLFFLLSGLVFNQQKYASAKVLFPAKARQLLKPWAIMWTISLLICLMIPAWRANLDIHIMLREFHTTMTNNVQNSSLWYLLCLFTMYVIFFFVNKIPRNRYTIGVMVVLALALPWMRNAETSLLKSICDMPDNRLPFKIDSALVGLVFFCIGAWLPDVVRKFVKRDWPWWLLALSAGAALLVAYLDSPINIQHIILGKYKLLFYPVALSGIAAVMMISYKIASSSPEKVRDLFAFYGRNSLLIFGFQTLFIRLYILVANNIFGLDMRLYANNPAGHQIACYVIVTFIIMPLVAKFFLWLRGKGVRIL